MFTKLPGDLSPTILDTPAPSENRDSIMPPVHAGPTSISERGFEERYELRRVLGEGGMGEVRLCKDLRIGREVAVKMIRAGFDTRTDFQARFLREARVQGGLEHPSIVPVYDLGIGPDGAAYFTMKRIRGMTLEEILLRLLAKDKKALHEYSRRKLLAAFGSVCLAIEFAHAHAVLHRDLKPSNIMLGTFGEVYVLDWGVAKITADEGATYFDTGPHKPATTAAGTMIGTLGFMSPEQFKDEELDPRTDIYSLGAILFELLTLKPLHSGTLPEIAGTTANGADARASLRAPESEVPPELERICVKATALDPKDRFASARHLHDAIERYLDGDRDMELRRDLSDVHARNAAEAAQRAVRGTENSAEQRAIAMREAGKALALDPTNAIAMGTMSRLLLEPPKEIPPEALASLERAKLKSISVAALMGIYSFLTWFLLLPIVMWMGVLSWGWMLAAAVSFALGAIFAYIQYRHTRPWRSYTTLFVMPLGLLAVSRLFGPEILVPSAALALAVTFGIYPYKGPRRFALFVSCAAVTLPLVLEWAGVLPTSYLFENGRIVVVPQMASFPKWPSSIALMAFHVMIIVSTWRLTARVRGALTAAEEIISVQAWHLRQIVPHSLASTGAHRPMP
ncbi:MAG: serine/threonine-protein kinase [Polyangiaceae bacterium]